MEWFKKKMRVFLFVCLLFPFYSYAAKISLSISGKIEDHSAMLYFPDGRELPISIDASGKGELVVDVTEPVYVALGYHYISRTLLLTPDTDIQISFENKKFGERVAITGTGSQVNIYLNNGRLKAAKIDDMALGEKAFFLKMDSILNVNLQELDHAGLSEEINEMEKIRLKYFTCATLPSYPYFHMRRRDARAGRRSRAHRRVRHARRADGTRRALPPLHRDPRAGRALATRRGVKPSPTHPRVPAFCKLPPAFLAKWTVDLRDIPPYNGMLNLRKGSLTMLLHKPRGQMSESLLMSAFVILSGGLQDAYTYLCRGGVFANAQTGNIVLFSTCLFEGDWHRSLHYLVPVLSFMLGIFVAECVHRRFKHMERVHWRQLTRGSPRCCAG